jgi:hypothetical protein
MLARLTCCWSRKKMEMQNGLPEFVLQSVLRNETPEGFWKLSSTV